MWFCPDINSGLVVLCNQDVDQVGDSFYFDIPLELWNFALSYIPVTCILTPLNPPIIIPQSGGSFNFTIDIENQSDSIAVFDVWIDVTLPSGEMYGPLILRENISLPSLASITRQLTQNVPAGAPAGLYSYNAYVGEYPQYAWNQGSFSFTKDEQVGVEMSLLDWLQSGWQDESTLGEVALPNSVVLCEAYPNPFNPTTTISFALPVAETVNLSVYDLSGRQVAILVNGRRDAGVHEVTFEGSEMASGVYIYQLTAGEYTDQGKMVLLK
jgi:hypothetical protein